MVGLLDTDAFQTRWATTSFCEFCAGTFQRKLTDGQAELRQDCGHHDHLIWRPYILFAWGFIKYLVYKTQSNNIHELHTSIHDATERIKEDINFRFSLCIIIVNHFYCPTNAINYTKLRG
jgi:hypothetical protein